MMITRVRPAMMIVHMTRNGRGRRPAASARGGLTDSLLSWRTQEGAWPIPCWRGLAGGRAVREIPAREEQRDSRFYLLPKLDVRRGRLRSTT